MAPSRLALDVETTMAHDVFISYAHHDKAVADAVCAKLEEHQLRCWVAPRDVVPGADWASSIIHAINDTRVMVLVFSSKANESLQIQREVERAVHKSVIIIPLRIEDVVPTESLEYFMSNVHWLDAMTPPLETHLKNLADIVNAMLKRTPSRDAAQPEARIRPPAIEPQPTIPFPVVAVRKGKPVWEALRMHPRRVVISSSIIGVALAIIFWFVGTQPVLSFSPRDWILLSDFDNQTGETVFDRSLLTALTVSLEQSAHANIFPRARIADTLKRMNKPATEGINESVGREICLRENIRGLLDCRIARVGQEYVLSAQLIDPRTGNSVRSYLERAKGQDSVLNALDKIASRLRRDLGESLSSIQMADRPLPLVTTGSLQALKNFVDGSDAWRKGNFKEAVQFYKNAVQLDPDFAMAHEALGEAYYSFKFNDPVNGKTEFEKALQLSTRTTERERLVIQADYAGALGHVGEADNLYHLYLDKYPDDWMMRNEFAALLRGNHQYQDAIDQYLQVLRIAPKDAGAYINIATSYIGLGNFGESLRYYGQAFELEPEWKTNGNLNSEYGFTLVEHGDEEEATRVFELALAKPDMKGLAERSLGWLALYHGQYRTARSHFEASLLFFKATKVTQTPILSETRTDILLAIVADGQGDRVRSRQKLDEAAKFLPELGEKVWMGTLAGCAYARSGVPNKAEQILRSIKPAVDFNNPKQSSQYHRLEGEIALAEGKKARALESFNLAQNAGADAQTMEGLARSNAAAGELNQSIEWYEKVIAIPDPPLGWEPQQDWLAAHYYLAQAYLSRGE